MVTKSGKNGRMSSILSSSQSCRNSMARFTSFSSSTTWRATRKIKIFKSKITTFYVHWGVHILCLFNSKNIRRCDYFGINERNIHLLIHISCIDTKILIEYCIFHKLIFMFMRLTDYRLIPILNQSFFLRSLSSSSGLSACCLASSTSTYRDNDIIVNIWHHHIETVDSIHTCLLISHK